MSQLSTIVTICHYVDPVFQAGCKQKCWLLEQSMKVSSQSPRYKLKTILERSNGHDMQVRLRPPWSPVDPPRKKKEARPNLRDEI